jgi:hypothetical protein
MVGDWLASAVHLDRNTSLGRRRGGVQGSLLGARWAYTHPFNTYTVVPRM